MIVVFDVLQSCFGDDITVVAFFFRVTKEPERKSVVGQPPAIAMGYGFCSIVRAVLPGTVGIGRTEDLLRPFELLGALNQFDGRSGFGRKTIPIGLMECNLVFGELVCVEDEMCLADAHGTVPIIRHTVVADTINMINIQPMVIHAEEIVPRELPGKVGAFAEIAEIVLGKGAHKGILMISETGVGVIIGKVNAGVAVHHVDNDGDAVLMRYVDELLKIGALPESLIHAEVPDRQITPVD